MEAESTDSPGGRHPNRTNGAHNPPRFFTGRMPFLPPNQQRQSTVGGTMLVTHMLYRTAQSSKCTELSRCQRWVMN